MTKAACRTAASLNMQAFMRVDIICPKMSARAPIL